MCMSYVPLSICMYYNVHIYIYICIIRHICINTYMISYILSCAYIYIHYHVYIYIFVKTQAVRTCIRNSMLFGVCPSTGWYPAPAWGVSKLWWKPLGIAVIQAMIDGLSVIEDWLVVYLPLWKIWVRQLGVWNSQKFPIYGKIIQSCSSHHQPVVSSLSALSNSMRLNSFLFGSPHQWKS